MIILEINNQVKARFNKKHLIKAAEQAGERLKLKSNRPALMSHRRGRPALMSHRRGRLVSLALVGTAVSRKLNKRYRRLDRPTDVLSFGSGRIKSEYLGEIIICFPLAKKQAREFKASIQKELERLLVHGLLHLTGRHH